MSHDHYHSQHPSPITLIFHAHHNPAIAIYKMNEHVPYKQVPLRDDLQQEIDSAVGQMRNNIQAVGQRGERLDALQDKTDNLATQANGFRRGANRVRKQMWWKDMKMRMCIIIGIIVLLVVIIVPSGEHMRPSSTQ